MGEEPLLTVLEAAARLGRNPETIRRWIREGRVATARAGRQLMLHEHDVFELEGRSPIPRAVAERSPMYQAAAGTGSGRQAGALTVPEVARRLGRNPETVRRWIREGRLPAHKVGGQHLIDQHTLADVLSGASETLPVPPEWWRTFWGSPMPDVVSAVRRSRAGH